MATIHSSESTQRAGNGAQKAIAFHPAQRIGDLSRIVEHDIEMLKINLEARSSAWERLESAWQTVRSELGDDRASGRLTGDVSPRDGAAAAAVEVDAPMSVIPTVPRIGQAVRWLSERARRVELQAAA